MSAKRNNNAEIQKVMNYLETNSGWQRLTLQTIKDLTNLSQYSSYAVLKTIKEHPDIEVEDLDNKRYACVRIKKQRTNNVSDEENKNQDKNEKHPRYKNLTLGDVEYINNSIYENNIGMQNIDTIINIMNIFAGYYKENDGDVIVNKYERMLANVLLLSNRTIKVCCQALHNIGLIEIIEPNVKVCLHNRKDISSIDKVLENEEIKTLPVSNSEEKSEHVEIKDVVEVKEVKKPEEPETDKQTSIVNTDYKEVITSISNFSGIINQFQNYLKDSLSQISSNTKNEDEINELKDLLSIQDSEIATLRNQLDEGGTALLRYITENDSMKDTIASKDKEIKRQRMFYLAQKEINDKIFDTMQDRFQIVIADIANTLSDYVRIPAWQLVQSDHAKVQNTIVAAITSAVDDILKANNNKKDSIDEKY